MTTSAEERARRLALECVQSSREGDLGKSLAEFDRVSALIAQAIRQAENDKLEEAARCVDLLAGDHVPKWVTDEIRSLKKD